MAGSRHFHPGLAKDEVIETGRHRYRFVPTPHLPHGWDAGVLFEEKLGVLLCSDLFHQIGDVEPVTSADVLGRWDAAVAAYQAHPVLMDYLPLMPATRRRLNELADLQPRVRLYGRRHLRNDAACDGLAQDVLLLTFYADREAPRIAEDLGISSGAVRAIRHRAMARLRDCVMGHGSPGQEARS